MATNTTNMVSMRKLEVSAPESATNSATPFSIRTFKDKCVWKHMVYNWTIVALVAALHLLALGYLVHMDLLDSKVYRTKNIAVEDLPLSSDTSPTTELFDEYMSGLVQKILKGDVTEPEAKSILQALDSLNAAASSAETGTEFLPIPQATHELLTQSGLLAAFMQGNSDAIEKNKEIIHLPNQVLNEFRDQYGIASIPSQNTWVLTEDLINLPLPGGGNISDPADFVEFGMKY